MNSSETFERNKNLKALGLTATVCGTLLMLFIFVSWTLPQTPLPLEDTGVEVNLGNAETGTGTIAPQAQEAPSIQEETNVQTPKTITQEQQPEETKEIADNAEKEAVEVKTAPKPEHKPKQDLVVTPKKTKVISQPVVSVAPPQPKPKALYKGGTATGRGGNEADTYNGIKNQGITGGSGDQGKPNGNPDSDSYTGNGGNGKSGVTIRSGLTGRRFARLPSFQDDFNENAKVAVDISVDRNGSVTAASVNPHGTTTTSQNIRGIAITKAKQLKLNSGNADEQTGTIVFEFKLKN